MSIIEFKDLYWAHVGSNEQEELYRKIYPELFEAGMLSKILSFIQLGPLRSMSIRLIGDIFGYLGRFQEQIKRTVFTEFQKALQEKVDSKLGFSIIVVGHSLGSVIVHDIISGLIRYRYAGLADLPARTSVFTMGSPLPLFSLVADTVDPARFRKWINFMHFQDPIGFPLGRLFQSVQDVRLLKLTVNPHSLYWQHRKVHKLIAEEVVCHRQNDIFVDSQNLRIPKEAPSEIFRPFHGPALTAGFSDYQLDFNKIPWDELIQGATQIDICNVYGRTWYRQNSQYFVKALGNPAVRVRVCMLSPESPAAPGFCHHFSGMSQSTLRENIESTLREILGAFDEATQRYDGTGHLQVYLSQNIINHSFYRFDNLIYFAPRPLSSDRYAAAPVPVVVFRDTGGEGGVSSWTMRDFNALLENPSDAILRFDSNTP